MTRYFIPRDTEFDGGVAGVRRMTVYVYPGDSTPIPDYYDEVQLIPGGAEIMGEGDRQQIETYRRLVNHPFFDGAAAEPGALSDTLVRRLDAVTDAIVIRREELPEVRRDGDVLHCGSVGWPVSRAHKYRGAFWRDALQYIALVEYLREHPPVDEAQVKGFLDLLESDEGEDVLASGDPTDLARFLVKHAARVEVTP